jgi:hypothetical protein
MQLEIAWAIFLEIIRAVRWPAALVHNLDLLVATWDPERGCAGSPAHLHRPSGRADLALTAVEQVRT